MEKCTLLRAAHNSMKIDARLAGHTLRDGDVKTACQQTARLGHRVRRSTGPIEPVVEAKADPRNYALLEEMNTKPRTTYLAKVRNPNPDLEDLRDPAGTVTATAVLTVSCSPLCSALRVRAWLHSSRPPIHLNPSMDNQPKVRPQTASTFFYDGQSMRQPVPGTIAIGGLKEDAAFFTGKGTDGQFVATIPTTLPGPVMKPGSSRPPALRHLLPAVP